MFMDYNADSFNSVCVKSASGGYAAPILDGLKQSLQSFRTAKDNFCDVIRADTEHYSDEDVLDYFNVKAGALIDNIDMLAAWCLFKKISAQLDGEGLSFVTDSLESGAVTSENILESFRKMFTAILWKRISGQIRYFPNFPPQFWKKKSSSSVYWTNSLPNCPKRTSVTN